MKKMILALSVGALALTAAPAAFATTFSPAGTDVDFIGNLTLEQTTILNCDTLLTMRINGAGTGATIVSGSFAPGSPSCSFVVPNFTVPWTVTQTAPGTGTATAIAITGVLAQSIAGICGSTSQVVNAAWDDAADEITITNAVTYGRVLLPPPAYDKDCKISGILYNADNPNPDVHIQN